MSPDERRQQLIALGVAALVDRPLEAVTVEDLATQAGVSTGLVHHYFGSRRGLHSAIVRTARDAMLHATEPRPELPPRERLRDTLERFVDFVRDHHGTFYSLVRGAASGDDEVRATVQHARDVLAGHLREAFQEIDYRAVFGTLAEWAVEIDDVSRLPETVARAWSRAGSRISMASAVCESWANDEAYAISAATSMFSSPASRDAARAPCPSTAR
jgi:AcrR family transcriptional regulator